MNSLKVEILPLKDLKPYKNNPRKNDNAVDYVANSIKEFGFKNPIIVDDNMEIIAGHTRYKAAKKLKIDTVPVIKATDLTPEQVKAFRIADNKTGEFAEWDMDLVNIELADLMASDYDIGVTGFEYNVLEPQEVVEDDFDVDANIPDEPITKRGDIWQLGTHRLMCGDSTVITDVEKLMDGNKGDMVFTDPPYNVAFNGRSGKFDVIKNDNLDDDLFQDFIDGFLNIMSIINPMTYYICCNWAFYGIMQLKLKPKACIVWAKNVFGLGKGYRHQHEFILFDGFIDASITNESDLWQISKASNYVHPTQKPVELPARAIKNSTKENCKVIDLFGGSGSTLIACEQTNRICYMMELDEKYCDVIIKRWETLTGQKAELIKG